MNRILLPCLLLLTTAAFGQDHDSPYSGLETRDIKSLSDTDIENLLSGAGMGYALAAELNGFPGPKHVLELADELELTDDQRRQTETLFAEMQNDAQAFGRELIKLEQELDQAFAEAQIDGGLVQAMTLKIGAMEGMLRASHLKAHIKMTSMLTTHQRHRYQELRGYDSNQMDHQGDQHDH